MIALDLRGAKRILCLGAHSDDIEIGCGGTILRLLADSEKLEFYWMVLCANSQRAEEAQRSANAFLEGARKKTVVVKSFRDGFLPYIGAPVKECFEKIKREFAPDVIFTHFRNDLHQDHRMVSELTWNTFRNHLILEYEIPKYDGDLGTPNTFVPVSDELCRKKIKLLMRYFRTQTNKHWFTEDLLVALPRIRGMECGVRYAEAFYGRKLIL